MGFLDKIKSAANAITGGAAKVSLEVEPAILGGSVPVRIRAVPKSDLKIDGVYLLVRCVEHAEVTEVEVEDGEVEREKERGRVTVFEQRYDVAGADELSEGEERTWEGELSLPPDGNPTLHGRTIHNVWEVQAGLDAFGNDPDSGWQELHVRSA